MARNVINISTININLSNRDRIDDEKLKLIEEELLSIKYHWKGARDDFDGNIKSIKFHIKKLLDLMEMKSDDLDQPMKQKQVKAVDRYLPSKYQSNQNIPTKIEDDGELY
jgi:hypothetical protein